MARKAQPDTETKSLLPSHKALESLPLSAILVITAEAVALVVRLLKVQHSLPTAVLRANDALLKMAHAVARKPQVLIPSPDYCERAARVQKIVFVAGADAMSEEVRGGIQLLTRHAALIRSLCESGHWAPSRYESVREKALTLAASALDVAFVQLPDIPRVDWASGFRLAVVGLQGRSDFSQSRERRSLVLCALDRADDRTLARAFAFPKSSSKRPVSTAKGLNRNRLTTRVDHDELAEPLEKPSTSHSALDQQIATLDRQVDELLADHRRKFQALLTKMTGATYATYDEKKAAIDRIKTLAKVFRLRFVFEDKAVRLSLLPPSQGRGTGQIQLIHDRKPVYGRTAFPPLTSEIREENDDPDDKRS